MKAGVTLTNARRELEGCEREHDATEADVANGQPSMGREPAVEAERFVHDDSRKERVKRFEGRLVGRERQQTSDGREGAERRQKNEAEPNQEPGHRIRTVRRVNQDARPASVNVSRLPNGSRMDMSLPQGSVSIPGRAYLYFFAESWA